MKFILVDYYDVYEEEEGVWCVNDLSRGDEIYISEDSTDEEIFNYLRDTVRFFKKEITFDQVLVEWSDETFCEFFEADNYMPLCRLEKVR